MEAKKKLQAEAQSNKKIEEVLTEEPQTQEPDKQYYEDYTKAVSDQVEARRKYIISIKEQTAENTKKAIEDSIKSSTVIAQAPAPVVIQPPQPVVVPKPAPVVTTPKPAPAPAPKPAPAPAPAPTPTTTLS